jgi:hypothetical protein
MDEVLISAVVQPAICPSMPTTLKRVETSAGRGLAGLWSLASERELTQIGVADADQCRRFTAVIGGEVGPGMDIYPAHTIIRNFFGSMTRKLSVTSSQYVGQFLGTSLRRKFSIAMLKSLNVA